MQQARYAFYTVLAMRLGRANFWPRLNNIIVTLRPPLCVTCPALASCCAGFFLFAPHSLSPRLLLLFCLPPDVSPLSVTTPVQSHRTACLSVSCHHRPPRAENPLLYQKGSLMLYRLVYCRFIGINLLASDCSVDFPSSIQISSRLVRRAEYISLIQLLRWSVIRRFLIDR